MHILGPQHREFRKEILQTMRVGVGLNTENFERNSTNNASWGGAPTQRISKRNSTNNAS